MDTAEKPGTRVSHITLDRKRAGKPIAGNGHDGFEVAGAGNQLTVWLVRHSQRKRGATDRLNLRSMAPVLDPTRSAKPLGSESFVDAVAFSRAHRNWQIKFQITPDSGARHDFTQADSQGTSSSVQEGLFRSNSFHEGGSHPDLFAFHATFAVRKLYSSMPLAQRSHAGVT